MGTEGRGGNDVVRVGGGGERIAGSASVKIVCVVVYVVCVVCVVCVLCVVCVHERERVRLVALVLVALVHWETVDVWFVVVGMESGVVIMSVGVEDGHVSGIGSCLCNSMSSRRGFGSVFEFDLEVFGADIWVLGADLIQGLGFGFVELLVASVEKVVVCRAFLGISGGGGCTYVSM